MAKGKIPGSRRSMHGFILTYSRLQTGEKISALRSPGNVLYFSVRSTPQREFTREREVPSRRIVPEVQWPDTSLNDLQNLKQAIDTTAAKCNL